MNLLAIETTGAEASVAIINEKKEIHSAASSQKMSHLQNLVPMIGELLQKCGLALTDISGVAVSEGPGSFTGIRIGIATAKALAGALGIPVIGVPTLQAFAWNVPRYEGLICPIFDARREQVYAGAYYWKEGQCVGAVEDGAYAIEEFLESARVALETEWPAKKEILLLGEGVFAYEERVKNSNANPVLSYASQDVRNQKASSVVALALQKWEQGEVLSIEELKPVYIRKAEAQRKLDERLAEMGEAGPGASKEAGNTPRPGRSV